MVFTFAAWINSANNPLLEYGVTGGLIGGLTYWLALGFFFGLFSQMLGEKDRIEPNQGIYNSFRNAILTGCFYAFAICLLYIFMSVITILTYSGMVESLA